MFHESVLKFRVTHGDTNKANGSEFKGFSYKVANWNFALNYKIYFRLNVLYWVTTAGFILGHGNEVAKSSESRPQ